MCGSHFLLVRDSICARDAFQIFVTELLCSQDPQITLLSVLLLYLLISSSILTQFPHFSNSEMTYYVSMGR